MSSAPTIPPLTGTITVDVPVERAFRLDPTRMTLLALDFQNYGVHPKGYWASHGEPDWPAMARPAVDTTARVLAAARRHRVLVIHVGVAWRPGTPR